MLHRLFGGCLAVVLVGLIAPAMYGAAKPPDLPLRDPIYVRPGEGPLPSCRGPVEVEFSPDPVPQPAPPSTSWAAFFKARAVLVQAPPASEPGCPYLRGQADKNKPICRLKAAAELGSVLDNLRRLELGAEVFAIAHQAAQAGNVQEALQALDVVHLLCPGSPLDARCDEVRLEIVCALPNQGGGEEAAEEDNEDLENSDPGSLWLDGVEWEWTGAKKSPGDGMGCPAACPYCQPMHARLPGVDEQVSGLMKASHLALTEGRHEKAAALAREAHALDPERVEADPVVYKLHLLAEGPSVCDPMLECERASATPCPFVGEEPIAGKDAVEGTQRSFGASLCPLLSLFFRQPAETGSAEIGFGPSGLRFSGETVFAGAHCHVLYDRGFFFLWMMPEESSASE